MKIKEMMGITLSSIGGALLSLLFSYMGYSFYTPEFWMGWFCVFLIMIGLSFK